MVTERGEYILKKNSIYENNILLSTSSDKYNLIKQKPNKKFAYIFPIGTSIYGLADKNPEKTFDNTIKEYNIYYDILEPVFSKRGIERLKIYYKDFNKWLENQGDPYVIYSPSQKNVSANNLKLSYSNIGFLDAKVNTITKIKDNNIYIDYYIQTSKEYTIEKIKEDISSKAILKIYEDNKKDSFIKTGDNLNINTISNEINRLTKIINNSGFYFFNNQFIKYEIDTLNKKNKCFLTLQIADPYLNSSNLKPQRINKINVLIDKNKNLAKKDSLKGSTITLIGNDIDYHPIFFEDFIFIKPDSLYSFKDVQQTYRSLNSLNNFLETKIKMNPTDYSNQLLDVDILLKPMKENSFSITPQLERTNTRYGTNIKTAITIRNLFGGAENLQTSINTSLEVLKQQSFGPIFFNAWEISLTSTLKFPRIILLPKGLFSKNMYPFTSIYISITNQSNIGVDKINFDLDFKHTWSSIPKNKNILSIINSEFSSTLQKDKYFENFPNELNKQKAIIDLYKKYNPDIGETNDNALIELIKNDDNFLKIDENKKTYRSYLEMMERKERILKDEFILSSSYRFIYNDNSNLNYRTFYLDTRIELAGYLPYLTAALFNLDKNTEGQYTTFNIPFSQYLKLDLDIRYYMHLTSKNNISIRFLSGIIIPHGNSKLAPFQKSYFAGGSNDIRAWKSYTLGPGETNNIDSYYKTAEFKLLSNIEYRFNIRDKLNAAIFFDIGNIWDINSQVSNKNFDINNFISQLAVGSGIGLRYDFGILVFRIDAATPIYDPGNTQGNRWLLNNLKIENIVYNFGIGYPF